MTRNLQMRENLNNASNLFGQNRPFNINIEVRGWNLLYINNKIILIYYYLNNKIMEWDVGECKWSARVLAEGWGALHKFSGDQVGYPVLSTPLTI